ncbi:MAG: hypothetical protein WBP45_00230 [Daejeonella sp.]
MKKSKAINAVKDMPENFQIDELIEKLVLIDKVEKGLKDIEEGNLVEHSEVIKQVSGWLKK